MSYRINEKLETVVALAPKSQTAAGSDTSAYVDAKDYEEIEFLAVFGAVAAGKTVTVDIYAGNDNSGTGAVKIGTKAVTAGTGGITSGQIRVSAIVTASRGRYYAAKIANDAAAAVLVGVTALGRVIHRGAVPENALNI